MLNYVLLVDADWCLLMFIDADWWLLMLINLFDSVAYWCSSMNIYAGRFQLMLLVINSDWYWLLLIDAGAFWCRLIMIDTVLLIDANCCSSKLIDAGWCWFMLIDAVLWRLIMIDANWQAAKLTRWHGEMMIVAESFQT